MLRTSAMPHDQSAFEQLLLRHAADLERIVRQYVDDPDDREDCRQELALALWRAMPGFRHEASERTYVFRIAQHRAITFCLKLSRRRALHASLLAHRPAATWGTTEVERAELHAVLEEALEHLSVSQRAALSLASAGHRPRDIAALTGSTTGAVRVALHRARQVVRAWLVRAGMLP